MVDTSETDNDQSDWKQKYALLRCAYEGTCRELHQTLFECRVLSWLERVTCGLVGVLLSLVVVLFTIYGPCAQRETQAENDLIHALETYRKATCAENVRHWFKTIGH